MKQSEWIWIAVLAVAAYVFSRPAPLASRTIGAGGLLTLPPGLPSGQANINAALGYDAMGNLAPLPSRPIGSGYVDLIAGGVSGGGFDDGLAFDSLGE